MTGDHKVKLVKGEQMTHTPGPWTFGQSRDGLKVSARQLDVAYTLGQGEKATANARLIAAAPDLLAALEGIIQLGESQDTCPDCTENECDECGRCECAHSELLGMAHAAIAAAKGETHETA